MAIRFETEPRGSFLLVKASGRDEDVADVEAYGLGVIAACVAGGLTHVLCDERELEYRLGTLDIFESAAFIAAAAPKVARVAIVCQPRFAADAAFWEDVAVNRGLTVRMFRDVAAAETWLGAPAG